MQSDVKTFRGRTLEELLPQIREELGPDAIVLRRREGLSGGIGGFFQRSFVEVDARRAQPGELPLEARNDRATTEGLSAPGVQALIQQAAPFADALARAESSGRRPRRRGPARGRPRRRARAAAARVGRRRARGRRPLRPAARRARARSRRPPTSRRSPRRPPQDFVAERSPRPASRPPAIQSFVVAPQPRVALPAPAAAREVIAAPPLAPERPAAADAAEQRLVAAGLSAGLAADVVGEAVTHGLPFAAPPTSSSRSCAPRSRAASRS